jgi:hypothetical protein
VLHTSKGVRSITSPTLCYCCILPAVLTSNFTRLTNMERSRRANWCEIHGRDDDLLLPPLTIGWSNIPPPVDVGEGSICHCLAWVVGPPSYIGFISHGGGYRGPRQGWTAPELLTNQPCHPTNNVSGMDRTDKAFIIKDSADTTTYSKALPNEPFFPHHASTLRQFIPFARFDNDPEVLNSIQDLNIPLLAKAVWQPHSDAEGLRGGFGYIERASWNKQNVAVKFLKSSQTISGTARIRKVGVSCLSA